MSWVRIDDSFYDNPKVKRAGLAAVGLYAMALSYCGRHLTDGYVDPEFVKAHGTKTTVARLTGSGLWTPAGKGWRIADYLDFNFSREQVLERREDISRKRSEAGKRGAEARWQNGKPDGKPDGTVSNTVNGPVPTRPIPIPDCKGINVSGGSRPETPDLSIRETIERSLRSVEGGAA